MTYRYSQGKAAKFCQNPGDVHIQNLQHLLRFLKGSDEYGVNFVWSATDAPKLDGPLDIVAWSDSSFADDIDSAKTTLGFVIQVNGSTVAAMSKLSPRVDSCVNHSELGAFDEATAPPDLTDGASISLVKTSRSVVWVRGVKAALERRDERSIPPTRVNVDSAGVLAMLKGITVKAANRHIFRSLAENRERVSDDRSVLPVKQGGHSRQPRERAHEAGGPRNERQAAPPHHRSEAVTTDAHDSLSLDRRLVAVRGSCWTASSTMPSSSLPSLPLAYRIGVT